MWLAVACVTPDPSLQVRTVDDWLHIARGRKAGALQLLKDPALAMLAWESAGFAAEALIKAAIMEAHQRSIWWTKQEREEVWSHNLRALAKLIGASEKTIATADPYAPAWAVTFGWRRDHGYNTSPMSQEVAQGMYDAVFGDRGISEWISSTFQLTI
jgi:hypothetical protein